ncbi:hypothetical protein HHI36_022086 [Cryptolaemus montrouzieri]|uniref:Battenin n=1 Tax=Cryptolaemus montrouzieri TaxID=559131 RepID=A0ABD2MYU2_9CUCU
MFKKDDDIPDYIRTNDSYRNLESENRHIRSKYRRALLAYFILGLCNNFSFIALLTAATDIIRINLIEHEKPSTNHTRTEEPRACTGISSAIILLAEVLSATIFSFIIPFVPILVHFKILLCVVMTAVGYCFIASAERAIKLAMVGVVFISISCVMGEATLLQYTAYFHGNVISTWSAGTGVAGVFGALSYTLAAEKHYKYTMLGMISMPILTALTFWILLPVPTELDKQSVVIQRAFNEREVKTPWAILKKKSHLLPRALYKFIAPLGLVYFLAYYINQGLYELVVVDDKIIAEKVQYHWLQVAFHTGSFISRSSATCIYIRYIWIMTLFQLINAVVFTTTAIYWYIENYWVLLFLAVEEGLFAGAAYVNTFVKIGKEEPEEDKQFMSSMTCFGNNAGMVLAGSSAMLAHRLICKLPPPK